MSLLTWMSLYKNKYWAHGEDGKGTTQVSQYGNIGDIGSGSGSMPDTRVEGATTEHEQSLEANL